MNLQSSASPYHQAFRAELDRLYPSIWSDLGRISDIPQDDGDAVLAAILRRACQSTHVTNIMLGRQASAEIPMDWFVAHVERVAASVLDMNDEWEYRRLLELYSDIHAGLLHRLVTQGFSSPELDIREAAEDFICPPT